MLIRAETENDHDAIHTATFGINSEYDVPDDVFMALELQPDSLNGKSGTIKYHDAFRNL